MTQELGPCIDHGQRGDRQTYTLAPIRPDGRRLGLHVEKLISKTGEEPNGRDARHLCSNKRCINGDHLVWGTRADNMRDTGVRVLTDAELSELRKGYTGKRGDQARLSREFGISPVTTHQLLKGKRR